MCCSNRSFFQIKYFSCRLGKMQTDIKILLNYPFPQKAKEQQNSLTTVSKQETMRLKILVLQLSKRCRGARTYLEIESVLWFSIRYYTQAFANIEINVTGFVKCVFQSSWNTKLPYVSSGQLLWKQSWWKHAKSCWGKKSLLISRIENGS